MTPTKRQVTVPPLTVAEALAELLEQEEERLSILGLTGDEAVESKAVLEALWKVYAEFFTQNTGLFCVEVEE